MTNKNQSTALVTTPKLHAPAVVNSTHVATVKLVDDKTILEDKEDVRLKLPDILGRVLALAKLFDTRESSCCATLIPDLIIPIIIFPFNKTFLFNCKRHAI